MPKIFLNSILPVIFILSITSLHLNCKDSEINWKKIDPNFRKELKKYKKSPDLILEGILHSTVQLNSEQQEALKKEGVIIGSAVGGITTIRFPVKSLPFLTRQPYIIFLSKPSEHKPISPSE